ncbi:MAG: glycerol-3-phosphate 1-O-acyltransferase PlsY [Candidatus Delongbacteria bacterium]|jgi:glycerol-3-phosphate acyltransferase PlsY|nr:glycerol-3-phosphate 1-O-acyltransferase PlsY [Candidatus Delongbacteria bacterium]
MVILIIIVIVAYLLGSFNAAYWFGKWFHGIDIREHGSKNAGATNLLRVAGWKTALPAFIIDVAKAFGAVSLASLQNMWSNGSEAFMILQICLGILAVLGHLFPLFLGFRGGKGVASTLGVVLAVHPLAALSGVGVFLLVFLITRIVSISSMLAGISFPLFLFFVFGENTSALLIFSVIVALLLLISHKKNIKKLLNGQEKPIHFK